MDNIKSYDLQGDRVSESILMPQHFQFQKKKKKAIENVSQLVMRHHIGQK